MKPLRIILPAFAVAIMVAGAPGIAAPLAATQSAAPPAADPGGMLRTLPRGTYQCALPGDAAGEAFVVVPEEGFRISTASRYQSSAGNGTYILRGRELTFTRGPKKDERFRRVGDNQVRKLDADGGETDILCTRLGSR